MATYTPSNKVLPVISPSICLPYVIFQFLGGWIYLYVVLLSLTDTCLLHFELKSL